MTQYGIPLNEEIKEYLKKTEKGIEDLLNDVIVETFPSLKIWTFKYSKIKGA